MLKLFVYGALKRIIFWITWLLRLRYNLTVKGFDDIKEDGRPIIFMPNHPALIDPVLVTREIYKKFKNVRTIIDSHQANQPYIRHIMNLTNPILVPSDRNVDLVNQSIEKTLNELKSGGVILLYPSGGLMRSKYDKISSKSMIRTLANNVPNLRFILVRTTGLWGSRFSHAQGIPSIIKSLPSSIKDVFMNLIFFIPKRNVSIEFYETLDFPKNSSVREINEYLNNFYYNNVDIQNEYYSYRFWQKPYKIIVEEKYDENLHTYNTNISDIDESITKDVLKYLEELTSQKVLPSHSLEKDLFLDSLVIMRIHLWLSKNYGVGDLDGDALKTVADCILVAAGRPLTHSFGDHLKAIKSSNDWFRVYSGELAGLDNLDYRNSSLLDYLAKILSNSKISKNIYLLDSQGYALTFSQVGTAIVALAQVWKNYPEKNIGIMLPASSGSFFIYYSLVLAGKLPVFFNWTLGESSFQHCINISGVKKIITSSKFLNVLSKKHFKTDNLSSEWIEIEKVREDISLSAKIKALIFSFFTWKKPITISPTSEAIMLFTSGSEAKPKALTLTHKNLLVDCHDALDICKVKSQDSLLATLPPFHSLGFLLNMVMPVYKGIRLVHHANPMEAAILNHILKDFKVSLFAATPSILQGVIDSMKLNGDVNPYLRLSVVGAEKCSVLLLDEFSRLFPNGKVSEGYGTTECSPVVTLNPLEKNKVGSIGILLDSLKYKLLNSQTNKEEKSEGILLLSGDSIFSGYIQNDKTPKIPSPFIELDGSLWYSTGDVVSVDSEGYFYFIARLKRFVKIGGEMISLPAIEDKLVLNLKNIEKPDKKLDIAVVSYESEKTTVIVSLSTYEFTREELNGVIRNSGLSALHNIRYVFQIDEMPLLGSGKIDYPTLSAVAKDKVVSA